MKKIKIIQEQVSSADVKEVLQQPEFWTYYLDQVEYVPLASAIAGPANALLKFRKGDNIGAAASASSVIPFYKAIRALRGAASLGKQGIINLASEAGIDVTEDQAKDLLDRREDVEQALQDQLKARDGMSVKDYEKELDDLELQDQMKESETHVLEEDVMDSVYEFYNDLEIGMIKRYPDLGETIEKYGELLSYVPGPIGAAGGLAVFATKLSQGKEREAYSALFVALSALVGAKLIAKGVGAGAQLSAMGLAALKIQKYIPQPIINLAGGRKQITRMLTRYLPWITQAGANKIEDEVNAAGKVIKSVKDRSGFDEPVQVSPDLTMTVGESKIGPQSSKRVSNCEPTRKKKNELVLEAVIERLLHDKNI